MKEEEGAAMAIWPSLRIPFRERERILNERERDRDRPIEVWPIHFVCEPETTLERYSQQTKTIFTKISHSIPCRMQIQASIALKSMLGDIPRNQKVDYPLS